MQPSVARPEHERLSHADTTWYRLESPDNPVDIAVVLGLDGPVDFGLLERTVGERLLRYRRFRQRVVERSLHVRAPAWEDDPSFAIGRHVRRVALGQRTLEDRIAELIAHPLPMDRPLWEIVSIEGDGGGRTLLARLHHCIADGFALVRVLLGMADDAAEPSQNDPRSEGANDPAHTSLREVASDAGRTVAALSHLVRLPFDRDSALRRPLLGVRRVAWSSGIPLERVKEIAHRDGGTVNDVLMSALAGALRRHLEAAGDALIEPVRAIVPVNLRPVRSIEEMAPELGNRFGLVFLELPVHLPDPRARLDAVEREMRRVKQSREAIVAFGILAALGVSGGTVENVVSHLFARKASLVATNVPGPKRRLRFAGREIRHIMFWVPHPVRLGLGLSILSYAGEIVVGVRADEGVHGDPGSLVRAFEAELAQMVTPRTA